MLRHDHLYNSNKLAKLNCQSTTRNVFLVISGINILVLCVNSSVNFLIYIATSSVIGNSFRRLLPPWLRCKRAQNSA
ncbi:hypothetical protein PoB_001962100 [Plakobranchus ocellatus]|uniref:Uncharacterized protein n=1 Tax=Plakobranchus ocellatus TaxID=259542 RepID=A0AAV3ZER2_9GAST|nr:hypothetical protein PoB_001962100 [Plakobranchus ocellatus]